MIKMKVVTNDVINSLGYAVFTQRASEVGKIQPFYRKFVFGKF